jgi:hypothetical protein
MGIINGFAFSVMLAMNRGPLFGHHAGSKPEPKPEKVRNDRMQIQGTMRLAAMQKDGDSSDRDVCDDQCKNRNLPPRPIQIAIG